MVTRALALGGTRKHESVARHLTQSLRHGDNPKRVRANAVWARRGDASTSASPAVPLAGSLPLSTYSERIRDTKVQHYLGEINRQLPREARAWLARLPPDGGDVWGIIDGHQENYHFDRENHPSPCLNAICRCHYMLAGHSDNKTKWAHEWVIMALAWQHNGARLAFPVHVKPILGLSFRPPRQVQAFARLVYQQRLPVRLALMDREYDTKELREVARRLRFPIGFRVGWNANSVRALVDQRTGRVVTLQELARRVIQEGEIRTWIGTRGRRHLNRFLRLPVRFPGDGGDYELVVSVELLPAPGPDRWRVIRPIAVAVPMGLGGIALRLYRRRWQIETMFHLWALDENKCRPKNIHSHVVQYAAFVVFKALTICGVHWWRSSLPATDGRRPHPLIGSIEFGRWILESAGLAPD